jgi:Activator of Hsp90 ATPase homolog 1-like protein
MTVEAIEPIRLSFEVGCAPDHAFRVWTEDIDRWWPADHTVTGTDDLLVVLEPRLGGRIYERTPDGLEHDWGEVTVWEPPTRLGYLWHLRRDRADATKVEIRFEAAEGGGTRIEIEHRNWEILGSEGESWRDRNRGGWATLLPWYIAHAEASRKGDRTVG